MWIRLVAAVVFVLGASACGPESDVPEWLRNLPTPVPAATGAPVPVTPVSNPLPLDRFVANPCSALGKDELAQLSIVDDPLGPIDTDSHSADGPSCSWFRFTSASVLAFLPGPATVNLRSLAHLVDLHRRQPELYTRWTETSIDGLPVIISIPGDLPERSCNASIGVADDTMLVVNYELESEKPVPHWENDPCGAAAKAAELIIRNLR
ncbi:DUF3558 domain-containing protein [Amycolatopsis suaedae]|uniref:DUF3558 domain-containing protein n=1 Tax=Amycolatopsis suaedae TaxID=2510978 RepID=A0A4Q7JFY4_9PSEU|nr:DUF3558 domain-containing protein [Amycolatopsis suaedae]RZQ65594.1 DUF3558 domain-containing protein [Amycolatopsis suaedae]